MKNRAPHLERWRQISLYLMIYDIIAVSLSYFLALLLRFDFQFSMIPTLYLKSWKLFTPIYVVFCIIVFWKLRLYKSIWKFASFTELQRIIYAMVITVTFHVIGSTVIINVLEIGTTSSANRMPFSYMIMGPIIQFVLISIIRFSYRFALFLKAKQPNDAMTRIALIGAGAAGQTILRDISRTKTMNEQVVCIFDDNKNKWGREIDGIPIIGGRDSILESVKDYNVDKIYIAIPSVSAKEKKKIIDICRQTECEIMNLPGLYQLALGDVSVNSLRKVEVEDLLGREPVKMNSKEVRELLKNKTVLVTGGGGSIGSELCRQVAKAPELKQLIIFDIYENNAHAIKLELLDQYPDLNLDVIIGSVRNSRKVKHIFEKYKPNIIFHAAAHKHVPLMEDSPCEAVKNNVLGTYYTAYAAMANNCEKYVLISTDKAVNPVNVMGASKRICEMIIQTFAKKIEEGKAFELPDLHTYAGTNKGIYDKTDIPQHPVTEFVAVRFGNVLGSNGSVIPRFREQIEKGGPVTVTHPDIIRYFMTIPEAASLVLEAAAVGVGGRIFVLDMGTPMKIDDLARNMIELSGFKPNEDIQIIYTGLRPGEKLFEERLMDEEGLTKTSNNLINIGRPIPFDEDVFLRALPVLANAAYEDREDIRDYIESIVDTYHPVVRQGDNKALRHLER